MSAHVLHAIAVLKKWHYVCPAVYVSKDSANAAGKSSLGVKSFNRDKSQKTVRSIAHIDSGVASSISEGDIFIYSCSAPSISFEIKSILKEVNCAEHKYMNMSPSLIELATPLHIEEVAKHNI